MDFTYIKFGLALAMLAILFGGLMGLGFGCCEETFKDTFKKQAASVLEEKYNGDQSKADDVAKKSWAYMKRAHLHSQTMGVISIVLSLVAAGLVFPPFLQTGIYGRDAIDRSWKKNPDEGVVESFTEDVKEYYHDDPKRLVKLIVLAVSVLSFISVLIYWVVTHYDIAKMIGLD